MGATALQKPFAPVHKLHSQAISTSHQLLCVDFQSSTCSPSSQSLAPNHFPEPTEGSVSADERDGLPDIQAFAQIGVRCQSFPSTLVNFNS